MSGTAPPAIHSPFVQQVLRHFAFLPATYGFRIAETSEHGITFASATCQVMVAFDRRDLYVDLASVESEPIRRVRFSLATLVAIAEATPSPAAAPTVDGHLAHAAGLLHRYGHALLTGDWSLRGRIVHRQVLDWLEGHLAAVTSTEDSRDREGRWSQFFFELRGKNREHQSQAWDCLASWLHSADDRQRQFAEHVVAAPSVSAR